ncbi:MAG: M81 family metallopeptidase [Nitrospinae bacterium]|nr:M81 family metallopeptidase [Nitrospinota bacterium]
MKIAIGRIYHEANTFNPNLTTLESLKSYGYYEGNAMLNKDTILAEITGAVESAGELNIKLTGLIKAGGWAGGIIKEDDYEHLKDRLLTRLKEALPVDGVYLALHGAIVSEDELDVSGDILKSVRKCAGVETPVMVSCDMHANITERMMKNADALIGYHTCPHLDSEDIGKLSIRLLHRMIRDEVNPVMYWCKIPMITPADRHNTFNGPLKTIFDKVRKIVSYPEVLCASVFPVQPWLDVPELGWTIVVVTNGKTDIGENRVKELAELCWDMRKEFDVEKLSAKDAIGRANQIKGSPIVISDGADATNAGGIGNSTHLLSELLSQGVHGGDALVPLIDPGMAQKAHSAGVGRVVEGEVGKFPENPFIKPVRVRGIVIAISDGKFTINGHGGSNLKIDMGKIAAIKLGKVILVVSERPGPGHDPMVFRHIGLNPKDAKVVVVKSPVGFRAAYEVFAKEIILADTPGAASSNLKSFKFKMRPKPLYPFEEIRKPEIKIKKSSEHVHN